MNRCLALILLVPLALALVAAPVYLIQPFKPQTARALEVGYELKGFAPWATLAGARGSLAPARALKVGDELRRFARWATLAAAFASLALVLTIWRRSRRRWAKAFARSS